MKVLVINCGSSSLKYQLIDMDGEKVLCKGLCERIGMESSMITQDLYVNKIEDENNERIYKVYREKANIIKAEDIVKLREKYDISQRELTAILGFGKMTINRYERGGIPTKSQSDYIKLLIENDDKFIEKVKEAYEKNNINEKTYRKIVSEGQEENISKKRVQENIRRYLKEVLNRKPNIYNGYKSLDLEKIENIISYIASGQLKKQFLFGKSKF